MGAIAFVLLPTPTLAWSQLCYVGESPSGSVNVYARRDAKSKILARLTQFEMVSIRSVDRLDWAHVKWSLSASSGTGSAHRKKVRTGRIRREDIRGECED